MQRVALAILISAGLAGCGTPGGAPDIPPGVALYSNPAFVPAPEGGQAFDQIVDVVDDYFTVDREEPVRQIGEVLTEGTIETFPEVGSSLLEPWRGDSANSYERLESTLQSIRRHALVRVIPTNGGLLLDVNVTKELEDVARPAYSTAGAATLRDDTSIQRYREPVGGQAPNVGWIPIGRDLALEQRIIGQVLERLGAPAQPYPLYTGQQPAPAPR